MASNMLLKTHHRSSQKLEKRLLDGFKCKLGSKYGENIKKLADAPSFCHTASPQVGPDWGKTLLWLKI